MSSSVVLLFNSFFCFSFSNLFVTSVASSTPTSLMEGRIFLCCIKTCHPNAMSVKSIHFFFRFLEFIHLVQSKNINVDGFWLFFIISIHLMSHVFSLSPSSAHHAKANVPNWLQTNSLILSHFSSLPLPLLHASPYSYNHSSNPQGLGLFVSKQESSFPQKSSLMTWLYLETQNRCLWDYLLLLTPSSLESGRWLKLLIVSTWWSSPKSIAIATPLVQKIKIQFICFGHHSYHVIDFIISISQFLPNLRQSMMHILEGFDKLLSFAIQQWTQV